MLAPSQVLDFLIDLQNKFVSKLGLVGGAKLPVTSVTTESLLTDVSEPFANIVSMYVLTAPEAAAWTGGCPYMLDRILRKVCGCV